MQRVGGFNGQMLDYIIENTFSHTPIPHIHTRTQTHMCQGMVLQTSVTYTYAKVCYVLMGVLSQRTQNNTA